MKIPSFLLALSLVIGLSGCEQYETVYSDDLDLVYTNYSEDFNFSSYRKYAVADSVVIVEDEDFDGTRKFSKYSTDIVNQIKKNMNANGWVNVPKNEAEVIILPAISQSVNVYYYYSWSYWGWYYPGYYPGWGWYYPGYYPGYYPTTASTYKTGTLFMQMTYPKDSATNDNIPVVWIGIVNGLAEGSTAEIKSRLSSTINQAFTQSPYLKK